MKKTLLITTILAGMAVTPAHAGGTSADYDAGYQAGLAAAKSGGGSRSSGISGPAGGVADALLNGTSYADVRYRYEEVDDDGFTPKAKSSTVRTRLGYRTGKYEGLQGVLEIDNISEVGSGDYNDGVNGKTTHPTVADPDGTEINQVFLSYGGIPDSVVKAGRQRIVLDNARFIGDVGWRQNNQTFDGAVVTNSSIDGLKATYGYISNINRIFGTDWNSDVHLVNAKYSGIKGANVTGYWYGLDIQSSVANSSKTYGARIDGSVDTGSNGIKLLYDVEYANQSDYGDNTTNYDAKYYRVEPGIAWNGFTLKGGQEVLGADVAGDATRVFRTPLATGHKWNGWADKFVATPAGGLEDTYGLLSYKVSGVGEAIDGTKLTAVYHEYSPDDGTGDFGSEWDLNIAQTFAKHYSLGLKYASYEGDDNATGALANDTQKVILSVGVKFDQLK